MTCSMDSTKSTAWPGLARWASTTKAGVNRARPGSTGRRTGRPLALAGVALLSAGVLVPFSSAQAFFGSGPACLTSVESEIQHAGTVSAINARITQMELVLSEMIGLSAEKIRGTIIDQTDAQQQMIQGQTDRLLEQLERLTYYHAYEHLEESFGESPPVTVCVEANAADSSALGEARRSLQQDNRREGIDLWTQGRDLDGEVRPRFESVASGSVIEEETLSTEAILMAEITDADGFVAKDELTRRLADFAPPAPLPESSRDTAHGVVYEATVKERRMRLAPARSVLEDRASRSDPVYPADDWFDTLMSETGYAGTSAGQAMIDRVQANDNRVSYDLRQRLQVDARSMNSLPYQRRLNTLSGDELTRELIKQQAIANNLAYDRLRLEQRRSVVEASETARHVDQDTQGRLNELRVRATTRPGEGGE